MDISIFLDSQSVVSIQVRVMGVELMSIPAMSNKLQWLFSSAKLLISE
jgi:hypothetical protein